MGYRSIIDSLKKILIFNGLCEIINSLIIQNLTRCTHFLWGGAHCIKIGIYSHIESIGLIQLSSPLWITNLKYIEIIKITKMQEFAKILV